MSEVVEFPTPERTIELFLYSVGLLQVDDDGLLPVHDLSDLEACAFLCRAVKALAIVPRDVQDILLFELADATEDLLTTAVLAPESDVVERWTKARVAASVLSARWFIINASSTLAGGLLDRPDFETLGVAPQ